MIRTVVPCGTVLAAVYTQGPLLSGVSSASPLSISAYEEIFIACRLDKFIFYFAPDGDGF
ncbi:MAG: hypothetical protein IH589_16030 [Anaerolineales bacterium]|nr:hypothetical protein [Anaerolineales bacterium]